MVDQVDRRIIRVGIEISGRINWYDGMRVKASGTKYANPLQNDCTVTISGLSMDTRDRLLTSTSPYNPSRQPKRLIIDVGRESFGTFRLFIGDITSAEPSPPPDVDVIIKAKTENAKAMDVSSVSFGATSRLSVIAQQVAQEVGVGLLFEAADKNIANWSYSGPTLKLVRRLEEMGRVRAFIDDELMIVKDAGSVIRGAVRVLNMDSGLVGIPKATEKGLDVTFLIDRETRLGGMLRLDSRMNKSLNGDYSIDQLKFDVTTDEDPFFYQAQCTRL
jgi:hypothetical protein